MIWPWRSSSTARKIESGDAKTTLLACATPGDSGVMLLADMEQFESFKATRLYCKKCVKSMPVRERLLLILPDKDIYEYLCTGCAESLGQREVTLADKRLAALHGAQPRRRHRA